MVKVETSPRHLKKTSTLMDLEVSEKPKVGSYLGYRIDPIDPIGNYLHHLQLKTSSPVVLPETSSMQETSNRIPQGRTKGTTITPCCEPDLPTSPALPFPSLSTPRLIPRRNFDPKTSDPTARKLKIHINEISGIPC